MFSTPHVELADLTGKVVFVTGAGRGIGYETVKALALRGATVYLGARDEAKGLAAVQAVEHDIAAAYSKAKASAPSPGKVIFHQCDIATPALAKESAEKFIEREERLDVLINNAAVLIEPSRLNELMRVNYFATVQLTQSLLPLLTKTAQRESDVRIVTISSNASTFGRANDPNIRFRTWEDYNPDFSKDWVPTFSAYAVSKLAINIHIRALQRRLLAKPETRNITCIAVHPGEVYTFSHRLPFPWLFGPLMRLFFYTVPVGALTGSFAAASPEVVEDPKKYQGAYLVPFGKVQAMLKVTENEEVQNELWESTEEILRDWPLAEASS